MDNETTFSSLFTSATGDQVQVRRYTALIIDRDGKVLYHSYHYKHLSKLWKGLEEIIQKERVTKNP